MNGYSTYHRLKLSRQDSILTIAIKGTTPMNLVDGLMHRELSQIWAEVRLDRDTAAVLLTGFGDRAFCAGGDMNWFAQMDAEEKDVAIAEGRRTIIDMLEVPQPIIAAVNGPAIGLGATLALFSDIVIADGHAVIGDPHVVLGLVAGDGGAIIWPWLIGPNRAKEFLLTGDHLDAARATELGLVNRVVPSAELEPTVRELATKIAGHSRVAVRGTKTAVNALLRDAVNMVSETSLSIERRSMDTPEYMAAVQQFLAAAQSRKRGAA